MNFNIDINKVTPIMEYQGEDEEDTALIRRMEETAYTYLMSFTWCKKICESYVGIGIGGVIGVFLYRIEPSRGDIDEWLWIVAGDLPPAYITTERARTPAAALDAYIGEMEEWVAAAREGRDVSALIPVNAEPNRENAVLLDRRLRFLDREVLSYLREDL